MEQETSLLHLLKEHQFILLIIGSLLIMSLLFGIGIVIGRRTERRQRKESNERE